MDTTFILCVVAAAALAILRLFRVSLREDWQNAHEDFENCLSRLYTTGEYDQVRVTEQANRAAAEYLHYVGFVGSYETAYALRYLAFTDDERTKGRLMQVLSGRKKKALGPLLRL